MKVLSIYSGGGGIDEGLKQAGIKTTLAIDHYEFCTKTMKMNHGCETITGKVSDNLNSLGIFDIVVGGPPCPEFSVAKANRTFDDTEVKIFWKTVEITKAKHWLMENVPGVIKVCKLKNFLINCANYGTPQTRIRRFFTNLPKPKETHSNFPSDDLFGDKIKKWVSIKDAIGLDGFLQDQKTTFGEGFRTRPTNRTSFTLLSDCRPVYVSPSGFKNENKKIISRSSDQPIQTILVASDYHITDKPVNSTKYKQLSQDYKIKRNLDLDELKILQGFPKDYEFFGNKRQIKYQIGNAVPSQPIKAFFEHIA